MFKSGTCIDFVVLADALRDLGVDISVVPIYFNIQVGLIFLLF